MDKDKIPDTWEWAQQLGCPLVLQEHEKRLLNNGVVSFAWDEISSRSLPSEESLRSRLNILLYFLRNNVNIPSIEHLNNTKRLKAERGGLEVQIRNITDEFESIQKSIMEKRLKIVKLRTLKKNYEKKSKILEAKHTEIKENMSGVSYLMSELNNCLPPKNIVINDELLQHTVALAGNISSREDKHEVSRKIAENLSSIAVPELWKWLLNKRTRDTEELKNSELLLQEKCQELKDGTNIIKTDNLTKLISDEIIDEPIKIETETDKIDTYSKSENSLGPRNSQINVSLAKIYGKNILNIIQSMKNRQKIIEYEHLATDWAEKLLQLEGHDKIMDWLESSMEIKSLEKKQEILKHYLDKFNHLNLEEEEVRARFSQLNNDIREAGEAQAHYIKEIEKSFSRVKNGCQFIFETRDRLTGLLKHIVYLSYTSNNNTEWLNMSLTSEIDEFYKEFDINGLNKIILSNLKSPYRHKIKCINNAIIASPKFTSITPVNQAPLYKLIDCFKHLMINELLNQEKTLTSLEMEMRSPDSVNRHQLSLDSENKKADTMVTLTNAASTIPNSQEKMKQLDSLYDIWANQPMQSVLESLKLTVDNVTLTEWIKRYTTLIYMIQRTK